MFNLQGSEIIVILLLALVVLGPEKLPDAIRKFSRTYAELRKMGSGFQSELKSALDEPMREMRETADAVRDAADPNKVVAQAEAERRLHEETADDDGWIDAPDDDLDDDLDEEELDLAAETNGHGPQFNGADPGSSRIALPGDPPGWDKPAGPSADIPHPPSELS